MKYNFVCIGMAKRATTRLHAIMRQHPDILLPCHKEPTFLKTNVI